MPGLITTHNDSTQERWESVSFVNSCERLQHCPALRADGARMAFDLALTLATDLRYYLLVSEYSSGLAVSP